MSITQYTTQGNLKQIKELVYDKCGFILTNYKANTESAEYEACSFNLNENKIIFRSSKITPLKTGQFVAIWKRNANGTTEPLDVLDDFDFLIITTKTNNNFGQFIFPKSVLVNKGIITHNNKTGKRGIRVYPPWDKTENKQSVKTQNWQIKFFISMNMDNFKEIDLVKTLFKNT